MEKVVIWYSVQNGGDGSAYPAWYLTEEDAEYDQESMDEGWGESCTGHVETFIGSDIHQEAVKNSAKQVKKRDEEVDEFADEDDLDDEDAAEDW